jgi:hypothetical protein
MPLASSRFSTVADPIWPASLTSMDVLFQVAVPRVIEAVGLERTERTHRWGGIDLEEGASSYRWGQYVELHPSRLQPWIFEIIPKGYVGESWKVFDVDGDGLSLWAHEVNGGAVEWMGRRLEALLQVLLSVDRWVVIFEPHFRQINQVIHCNTDECLRRLAHSLSRRVGEGFVAIAKDTEVVSAKSL